MSPWNPYPRLAPTVFLASCLFTAHLRGQGPGDSPGAGSSHSHGMRGPGGFQHGVPDRVLLEEPPAPPDFATIAAPDSAQSARYQSLYDNLMATTLADRDSLQATRSTMRAARESQNHESMRRSMEASQPLVVALQGSQQAFDDALKAMLSSDQFKRYEAWRQQRRKQAEDDMKRGMQSRSAGSGTP